MDKVLIRNGRVTPKYKGYMVSLWKKGDKEKGDKHIIPYNIDEVDKLIVETVDGTVEIPKEYLIKNKILHSENFKGKVGFRIKCDDEILKTMKANKLH